MVGIFAEFAPFGPLQESPGKKTMLIAATSIVFGVSSKIELAYMLSMPNNGWASLMRVGGSR
jgi:hypothetical protein